MRVQVKSNYLWRVFQASVHLNFRGSLRRFNVLFRHLLEQNLRTLPSRRTKPIPVPGAISFPQKLHLYTWGKLYTYLIFLASLSVSRRSKISSILIGPLTLRVMIRPLSLPSSILTRTCITSPVKPVLPRIWMTVEGVSKSESLLILLYNLLELADDFLDKVLGVAFFLYGCSC